MKKQKEVTTNKKISKELDSSNGFIAGGTALGALGVGEIALLGVACPLCFIGAGALVGYGAYKKVKTKTKKKKD